MRAISLLSPLAVGLTLAFPAAADIYEPNGLLVPVDSSPEIQLYTLFQMRGENLDWHHSAQITPNSFSPLCGFTATYILNQAGSHFGLAWYNETGVAPQPADLHQLLPPNSPVGTTFNGTVISSDPAYLGGTVGFALVGGQTHFTNSAYDVVCSPPFCSPGGPWVTSLMYASTVTPNAYYICFEDGSTDAFSFANDGDFNDDVFFVTGITCKGGGQPCDTGKPGICAAGLTQCSANGLTCQQLNQPAATETCNGLDDNCNGVVDEGAICPAGLICEKGTCVHRCNTGEFACPVQLVCDPNGYCVEPACEKVTCPSGKVCIAGTCKGPCDGVVCPYPDVCRVGACLDPCAGVTCMAGEICDQGVCVANCSCAPCAAGKTCDAMSLACVDPSCAKVVCPKGDHCVAGSCVDDCKGAVCPVGETCQKGACVASLGTGAGGAGTGAGGSTGVFMAGVGGSVGPGTGGAGGEGGKKPTTKATGAGASFWGSGGASSKGPGCACLVVATPGSNAPAALAAGVLALLVAGRRRARLATPARRSGRRR